MIGLRVFIRTLTLCLCHVAGVLTADDCSSRSCGPVKESAETHFRHTTVITKVFNRKEWMYLDCCADGFTDIQWHFRTGSNASWQAWPWFEPCIYCGSETPQYRQLCEKNQSLVFISPTPNYSGNYKCSVSNSNTGKEIVREFLLVVSECRDYTPDEIQFIGQPDSLNQRAEKGGNLTFTCVGNFGCPSQPMMERQANWSLVNSSGYVHQLYPHQNPRFHISFKKSFPYLTVSSTLTIIDVQKSDYSLVLMCSISTGGVHRTYNLTLHAPNTVVERDWKTIIIAVSIAGVVTLMVGILISVYCCYRPQLHYRLSRHIGTLQARDEDEEDYYDGCIIHSPVNTDFVEAEIKKPLVDENFDIFTKVPEGARELNKADNIGRSMCAILVLSKAEIDDHSIPYLFSVAVASCGSKMVVIEKEDIERDSWRAAIADQDAIDVQDAKGQNVMTELPKILKTIQWKGKKKMSRRQLDNFFAEIKLKLPAPKGTQRTPSKHSPLRINSDTSTRPLISDSAYPSNQSENGTRNSSKDSHRLQALSSSDNGETEAEVNFEFNDEVFKDTPPKTKPKPTPQHQISRDSGIATSI